MPIATTKGGVRKKGGGKPKAKHTRSAVTSKFSEKRLLSRHGKVQKKGLAGPGTEFVTRSQALKKLQITLKDFRRLCILKGIYPRVPSTKAPKGKDKIYYDIKDLSHLSHEPLLAKFRDFKAFMKKIRRASGREEIAEARRRDELKPQMGLDHLVKERYPRFIDALRDLDDALCMIHLFAAMPSAGRITAAHTATCAELCRHWQFYVARSHSLSKIFVSVKGVYFQAEVMGENITWLAPHRFTQQVPKEVDLRVMLTFLDFYEVFVRFTLFKLYGMLDLQYPPSVDKALDEAGCALLAVRPAELELAPTDGTSGSVVAGALEKTVDDNEKDDEDIDSGAESKEKETVKKGSKKSSRAEAAALADMQAKLKSLNQKLAEISEADEFEDRAADEGEERVSVEALTSAFAGFDEGEAYAGQDEKSVFAQADAAGESTGLFRGLRFFINREVPLDWLQLCIIAAGGQLGWEGQASPFDAADKSITHHVVDRPLPESKRQSGREYVQPQWVFDSVNAQVKLPVGKYNAGSKLPPHLSPFVDNAKEGYVPKYAEEVAALQRKAGVSTAPVVSTKETLGDASEDEIDEEAVNEDDDKSDDEITETGKRKAEPTAMDTNTKRSKGSKGVVFAAKEKQQTEDEENKELAKTMMSKKTARLYQRMQHGIQGKSDEVAKLEAKAKAVEKKEKEDTSSNNKKSASKKPAAKGKATAEELTVGGRRSTRVRK